MIRLTVQDGSIVQTLTLEAEKVFLGRQESNTIPLQDASVSRKHCMIRHTADGRLEVLDLNSRNGTRRNGESVERSPLAVGDELELGDVRIRIEALVGAPRAAAEYHAYGASTPFSWKTPEEQAERTKPARESKSLVSDAHQTTFSEEMFRQLRRMPWWAASIFVHTLVVYLAFLIPFQSPPVGSPSGRLNGDLWNDMSGELEDLLSTAELDDTPPEPELLDESILEEDAPIPADEPEILEEEPPLPPLGAALTDLQIPRGGISSRVSVPDSDFGQEGADDANRRAMALLQKSLRGGRGIAGALRRLSSRDVLVVEGTYDHVESVLDMLGLPHECASVEHLEKTRLEGLKVLLVNCSSEAPSLATIERIRRFVKGGGYLLTTDWGIENVIRRAFPDYLRPVQKGGRNVITPNEVVSIKAVARARRHFLLSGTSLAEGAKWWLEESSYPFEVLNPEEVEVLIESEELEAEYGTNAVAATFRYGKGRVFHMLGHFYQKEGNLKGTFSTQRLTANFLIAAIRRR